MRSVKLTVTRSRCRCGIMREGESFSVGEVCPPICMELWNNIYPYVFALKNGALLDYDEDRAKCFDAKCPDGGRVHIHGEILEGE